MGYYLGIDGGGTKTTVAVADENGFVFKQEGKSINFYSVGIETARSNLSEIMNKVQDKVGTACFDAAFIGCSALDGEADEKLISLLCDGVINAKKIGMNSDVFIALESVEGAACPCVAVCGTGSMAIGRDRERNVHITGGWGHIIGDEGSAYVIATEALKVCCEQYDKGHKSAVVADVSEFFGVDDFRKAIDIIYSPETTKDVIASYASRMGKLADKGDKTAVQILLAQAEKFASTVISLLKKIRCCDVLGLYGGVLKNNSIFADAFCEKIRENYPEIKIVFLDTPPEECALKLARKM